MWWQSSSLTLKTKNDLELDFELAELLTAVQEFLISGWLGSPSCRRTRLLRERGPKGARYCQPPVLAQADSSHLGVCGGEPSLHLREMIWLIRPISHADKVSHTEDLLLCLSPTQLIFQFSELMPSSAWCRGEHLSLLLSLPDKQEPQSFTNRTDR